MTSLSTSLNCETVPALNLDAPVNDKFPDPVDDFMLAEYCINLVQYDRLFILNNTIERPLDIDGYDGGLVRHSQKSEWRTGCCLAGGLFCAGGYFISSELGDRVGPFGL